MATPWKLVFHTCSKASSTGRFFSSGASRKWRSTQCAPANNASKPSRPRASATGSPAALHSENLPPTQSHIGMQFSAAKPKSTAASASAVTARKCLAMAARSQVRSRNQLLAVSALRRVSSVLKLFETTTTRVVCGSSAANAFVAAAPSMLARKRIAGALTFPPSASTQSSGPRCEPPIPMCRTVSNGRPVNPRRRPPRTASAMSRKRSRASATCGGASPVGRRSVGCLAARPSVLFTAAPANRSSMARRSPLSSASAISPWRASSSMRWREQSTSNGPRRAEKAAKRSPSETLSARSAKTPRRCQAARRCGGLAAHADIVDQPSGAKPRRAKHPQAACFAIRRQQPFRIAHRNVIY